MNQLLKGIRKGMLGVLGLLLLAGMLPLSAAQAASDDSWLRQAKVIDENRIELTFDRQLTAEEEWSYQAALQGGGIAYPPGEGPPLALEEAGLDALPFVGVPQPAGSYAWESLDAGQFVIDGDIEVLFAVAHGYRVDLTLSASVSGVDVLELSIEEGAIEPLEGPASAAIEDYRIVTGIGAIGVMDMLDPGRTGFDIGHVRQYLAQASPANVIGAPGVDAYDVRTLLSWIEDEALSAGVTERAMEVVEGFYRNGEYLYNAKLELAAKAEGWEASLASGTLRARDFSELAVEMALALVQAHQWDNYAFYGSPLTAAEFYPTLEEGRLTGLDVLFSAPVLPASRAKGADAIAGIELTGQTEPSSLSAAEYEVSWPDLDNMQVIFSGAGLDLTSLETVMLELNAEALYADDGTVSYGDPDERSQTPYTGETQLLFALDQGPGQPEPMTAELKNPSLDGWLYGIDVVFDHPVSQETMALGDSVIAEVVAETMNGSLALPLSDIDSYWESDTTLRLFFGDLLSGQGVNALEVLLQSGDAITGLQGEVYVSNSPLRFALGVGPGGPGEPGEPGVSAELIDPGYDGYLVSVDVQFDRPMAEATQNLGNALLYEVRAFASGGQISEVILQPEEVNAYWASDTTLTLHFGTRMQGAEVVELEVMFSSAYEIAAIDGTLYEALSPLRLVLDESGQGGPSVPLGAQLMDPDLEGVLHSIDLVFNGQVSGATAAEGFGVVDAVYALTDAGRMAIELSPEAATLAWDDEQEPSRATLVFEGGLQTSGLYGLEVVLQPERIESVYGAFYDDDPHLYYSIHQDLPSATSALVYDEASLFDALALEQLDTLYVPRSFWVEAPVSFPEHIAWVRAVDDYCYITVPYQQGNYYTPQLDNVMIAGPTA
ncbi:hypothetical protein IDH44_10295 [Paenibacillus sp. IB182496]|uniref:Uncharacterized protein n=1 Tax=Paenibacillus sabuli TaxID=2772509 RepID=A0A927GS20_9BACL|nr:hypothetical protein [Paenibacillus sabuli]MBD2845580.1 hypothetical protein [Paenibacillus sabuli]